MTGVFAVCKSLTSLPDCCARCVSPAGRCRRGAYPSHRRSRVPEPGHAAIRKAPRKSSSYRGSGHGSGWAGLPSSNESPDWPRDRVSGTSSRSAVCHPSGPSRSSTSRREPASHGGSPSARQPRPASPRCDCWGCGRQACPRDIDVRLHLVGQEDDLLAALRAGA